MPSQFSKAAIHEREQGAFVSYIAHICYTLSWALGIEGNKTGSLRAISFTNRTMCLEIQ
jgi:hypothetical protein